MSAPVVTRADRLIGGSVIGAVLLVWAVLVGLDAATQFAQELGDLNQHGYDAWHAALYILLTIPRRAYEMFGYAALIGAMLGFGGLAASSELTALRAAGMSRLRMAASVVASVGVLMVLVFVLGETVAPAGESRAQELKLSLQSGQLGIGLHHDLWARDGERIVHVGSARVLDEGDHKLVQLDDLRVYLLDTKGVLQQVTTAARAVQQQGQWQLHDARVTRFTDAGATTRAHAEMAWQTSLDPALLELSAMRIEDQSLRDLRRNIRHLQGNGQSAAQYLDASWARLFYPLDILLLVFAVLPLGFVSLRSGGLGKRIFVGILIAVAWHFAQRALVSVGSVYGLSAWLANLLPALLIALLAVIAYRRHA